MAAVFHFFPRADYVQVVWKKRRNRFISETTQDIAVVTTEELVCNLSNDVISNDLE